MRTQLLKLWNAAQPALRLPRLWAAYLLRALLWRTTFIAITGSNGKTTATRCLAAILSSQAPTQATRINRNTMPGITETIAFCNPFRTRYAVVEVGAGKPGAIGRAARLIRPDIAVVLSVFLEHRALFKTLEAVAQEKARLLAGLAPGGTAVVNVDDPWVCAMAVPEGRGRIGFGTSVDCEVRCEEVVSAWPRLLSFTAVVRGQRQPIRTRLLGAHWTGPLLAAIAAADHLGVPLERIAHVIAEMVPYPGRMQVLRLPGGAVVIRDEFKGSLHTVEAAFDELRKAEATRKFLVFCDLAESSLSPRGRLAKVGREAAELADYVIFIGESAQHGVNGARKAGLAASKALAFDGFAEAAEFLRPLLGPGDLVLLKASRNNQLPRLLYALVGEVRCTIPVCGRPMVCDDCHRFKNPELVRRVNEQLTVRLD
ncbi:MAG: Mur ligase family protein [Lysobacterales bacterium]